MLRDRGLVNVLRAQFANTGHLSPSMLARAKIGKGKMPQQVRGSPMLSPFPLPPLPTRLLAPLVCVHARPLLDLTTHSRWCKQTSHRTCSSDCPLASRDQVHALNDLVRIQADEVSALEAEARGARDRLEDLEKLLSESDRQAVEQVCLLLGKHDRTPGSRYYSPFAISLTRLSPCPTGTNNRLSIRNTRVVVSRARAEPCGA